MIEQKPSFDPCPSPLSLRSSGDYHAWIPRRIAELIRGREGEVEAALEACDARTLERIAGEVNAISIDGKSLSPEEVKISHAPTLEELFKGNPEARGQGAIRRAQEDILEGRVAEEFFFAGAATRFRMAARGLLYFFDLWDLAERVLAASGGDVPEFASGLSPAEFGKLREAVAAAAKGLPPSRRLRIPLGPRILLSYRIALERIARGAGGSPEEARNRARFIIHLPDSPEGRKILSDLLARNTYGFDRRNLLIVLQTLFGGWRVTAGAVVPIAGSESYPYGHGYSTMQLIQPGAAATIADGGLSRLEEDALSFLGKEGDTMIRTHRVNDLTQLSPSVLDLDRILAGRLLKERGHGVIIELVKNKIGQKGGNWLERCGGSHRFLLEGMNAKVGGWPEFLERHRHAPYNAFRNIYDGGILRRILTNRILPGHLRIRSLGLPGKGPGSRIGLYLESVTGDLTQIPEARAAAFRYDDREEIHDLKELRDLPEGIRSAVIQDGDEDFRRAAGECFGIET